MSKAIIGSDFNTRNLCFHVNKKKDVRGIFSTNKPYVKQVILDMPAPRVILNTEKTKDHLENMIENMTKGDLIMDCSQDYYEDNIVKSEMCKLKSVDYLGCSLLSGNIYGPPAPMMLVSGNAKSFYKQEMFLREFCSNVFYIDEDPSTSQFFEMVHNGMRDALTQGIYDIFAYCGQNNNRMDEVRKMCENSDIEGHLLSTFRLYNTQKPDDRYKKYTNLSSTPSLTINQCMDAKTMNNYMKYLHVSVPQPTTFNPRWAKNALRFLYATVILEGVNVLCSRHIHIMNAMCALNTGSVMSCPMMSYKFHDLYEILEETEGDTRQFLVQTTGSGIPSPSIQAALSSFDSLKYMEIDVDRI